jgi:hypothetical protein
MARIFFSRLAITVLVLFFAQMVVAQNSYYIFKKSGNPIFNIDTPAERGTFFNENDTLKLKTSDYVMLVNQKGELFELNTPNKFTIKEILAYKLKIEYTSFTRKYFTYVWRQFTNNRKSKQEAGVVYREGRDILLKTPIDSAKIYKPIAWYVWENKTGNNLLYFFLKDIESGHLTKIGTTSDSLLLHVDNLLLVPGKSYEWSVTSSAFPNLNQLKFNALKVLNEKEYLEVKKEVAILIKTFKILGFSEKEIQQVICMDYKYCDFEFLDD